MADKKLKTFKIKVWPSQWEMASIDPSCIALLAYTSFTKAPVTLHECLPSETKSKSLPEFETDELLFSGFDQLVLYLSEQGYDADSDLSSKQKADKCAFMAYIEQKLKPAITYTMWLDNENFNKVTRPAYSRLFGFPRSFWAVGKMRDTCQDYIMQGQYLTSEDQINEKKRPCYIAARECMTLLDGQLGKKEFFFGDKPTSIDALLYGYLSVLLKVPLVTSELKNHLNSCERLKRHCDRVGSYFEKSSSISNSPDVVQTKESESFIPKDTAMTFGIGLSVMLAYSFVAGIFTSKRSMLAHKLGTVTRKY